MKPEDVEPNVGPFAFYLDAFRELSSCRSGGFGLSPIPFTAIVEYARIYEVEDFHEFLDIVREMDAELLRLESQSQAKKSKDNGNGSKRNPGISRH